MGHFSDISQYTEEDNKVWNDFISFAGMTFYTCKNLGFIFEVHGNEVFVNRRGKSLTRSTIIHAYKTVRHAQENGLVLTGPKQLGVFGASYVFPVFLRMGII